ncbi:MAG: hypothetical protein GX804_05765 [Lentisphaerae bacterium]|nr:hypothetical protein [Lentisphaerota bacterium]
MLPYFYAFWSPVWSPFGVLGGRILTMIAGLAASCFCAGFAWRISDKGMRSFTALCAWLMIACCPVYSYFTVIPKTYALASLFTSSAFFVLAGKKAWRFEVAGILLAFACGTRLSLGALLAVVGIGLLLLRRRDGLGTAWLRFGIGGGLALAAIFLPFLLNAMQGFIFSQSVHASRMDSGLLEWLMLRAGSASRLVQGYFLMFAAFVVGLAYGGTRGFIRRDDIAAKLALAGWVAVSIVHYLAPFPYDDYQTPVMPLAAAFTALLFSRAVAGSGLRRTTAPAWTALVLAILFIGSSPLCMDWVAVRQDRFWMVMKDKSDVIKLREAGKLIRERTKPDDILFTQDAYIAVEAQRNVPRGLEGGPFSIFPDLADEEAAALNVHNITTLQQLIETTESPVAALSGYAFALASPSMEKLNDEYVEILEASIRNRYETVDIIEDFGQQHTKLEILTLKTTR